MNINSVDKFMSAIKSLCLISLAVVPLPMAFALPVLSQSAWIPVAIDTEGAVYSIDRNSLRDINGWRHSLVSRVHQHQGYYTHKRAVNCSNNAYTFQVLTSDGTWSLTLSAPPGSVNYPINRNICGVSDFVPGEAPWEYPEGRYSQIWCTAAN